MIKKCLYEKDCSSLSFVPRRNNVSERGRFDNGLQLSCLSCFENGIQIDGGRVFVYSQPQFVANRQLQRGNEKFALQLREILQCKILSEGTSWRKTVFCPGSGRLVSLYERFELCLEAGPAPRTVGHAIRLSALFCKCYFSERAGERDIGIVYPQGEALPVFT